MSGPKADVAKVIAKAESQLGVHEQPFGSNRQPYGEWYGMNGYAWCAMFVSWVFWHAGSPLPPIESAKGFAYTPSAAAWAKRNGCWGPVSSYNPKAGDITLFDFPNDNVNRISHTGIVTGPRSGLYVPHIEGNTNGAGGRTGGMVMRHNRNVSNIVGYVIVQPTNTPGPTPTPEPAKRTTLRKGDKGEDVKFMQAMLNIVTPELKRQGFGSGELLTEDGEYGDKTAARVNEFERYWNKKGPGQQKPLDQDFVFTQGTAAALAAIVKLVLG